MTDTKQGIWLLFKWQDGNRTRLFGEKPYKTHNVQASNDCDGDVLYDYMTENGIIENWNEYITEGDSEHVAVMHTTGEKPDYSWEFRAYADRGPASDDCHTYS